MKIKTLLLVVFLLYTLGSECQTSNLNVTIAEDAFRRKQLEDSFLVNISSCIRPGNYALDSAILSPDYSFHRDNRKKNEFVLLPVIVKQQYNLSRPFGWNDGSMISARGYQLQASVGFFAKYGPFQLKFNPEFVWAQNTYYDTMSTKFLDPVQLAAYTTYYLWIDNPRIIPQTPFHKFLPGQSSFSINFKSFALAASTENIWWGPGMRNSIILSNNTQGFSHLSFNTTKPVKTAIGYFEGQIISGITESSNESISKGYVSGMILSYSPKWTKGLFIGFTRMYNQFYDLAVKHKDYLPIFQNLYRKNDASGANNDDSLKRDQLISVFFRYVMQNAKAEFYAEYGRNDASYNFRDFFLSPQHTRAFTIGGQKLFKLNKPNEYIQAQVEITQTRQPYVYEVRVSQPSWYVHSQVTRGYTNKGKVLGAGIGPGSNSQSLILKWVRPSNTMGLTIERIENLNDIYDRLFISDPMVNRKWIDNVLGIEGNFKARQEQKCQIVWNLNYIHSVNYHWSLDDAATSDINGRTENKDNLQLKLSLIYFL